MSPEPPPEPAAEGEDRLLAWLRRRLEPPGSALRRGPRLGDDAAELPSSGPRVATVDSQIEGIHFPRGLAPEILGPRLLAVNLSDLAAMGAWPGHALLALSARPGFAHRRFFEAFLEACRRWEVSLAGGDLATSPEATVATLTLLGDLPEGGRFLHRRGARAGDRLWLGGDLGESGAGRLLLERGARIEHAAESAQGQAGDRWEVHLPEALDFDPESAEAARRAVRRHLEPEPQLELGRRLGRLPLQPPAAVAAMDLSDGLARDLPRLCAESGVGARLEARHLPRPEGFGRLCHALGVDPLDLMLAGGEDYVLIFTLPPGIEPPGPESAGQPWVCHPIGEMVSAEREPEGQGPEPILVVDGEDRPWPHGGWDHLSDGES